MPSEVMPDITLRRVTPGSGKGALGKWRAPYRQHCLDFEPGSSEPHWVPSRRYNHAAKGRM
jgi:hypothetical protein